MLLALPVEYSTSTNSCLCLLSVFVLLYSYVRVESSYDVYASISQVTNRSNDKIISYDYVIFVKVRLRVLRASCIFLRESAHLSDLFASLIGSRKHFAVSAAATE